MFTAEVELVETLGMFVFVVFTSQTASFPVNYVYLELYK